MKQNARKPNPMRKREEGEAEIIKKVKTRNRRGRKIRRGSAKSNRLKKA